MVENKQPWYYSWVVIIIALFLFWPVGLVLFILRLNHSKATASFGKGQAIICYVVAAFIILLSLAMFEDSFFMGLAFLAGGGAIIYFTRMAVKRSERCRQYINLIVNQEVESIDTIAGMCGQSYEVVLADLNKMVSQGIFKNAVIDQISRTISIPRMQLNRQPQTVSGGNGAEPPQMVTVTCSGCGAKMVVAKGAVCNCEYCDTPLNA